VDSKNLSLQQLRRLHQSVSEPLRYLLRLHARMLATEFPKDDVLRLNVERAIAALGALYAEADPEARQRRERQQSLGR